MADHQARRTEANRTELAKRIADAVRNDGTIEPLKGLHLYRISSPVGDIHGMSDPAFCVVAQGSKEVLLGESRYRYDPAHYLLTAAELPVVGQVEGSKKLPYLGMRLQLPPEVVGSVLIESALFPTAGSDERAFNVSPLDADLLDASVRLLRLLDTPKEARVVAPLIIREIVFRLLLGEQGGRLRQIAALGSSTNRITIALERLRKDFDQPLRIESLASELGMSPSAFHHHFKSITALSPMQFQKQLRLQEARRLMLSEEFDAASAGYRVGYVDPSHFSREYKRHFGISPMRDAIRLRNMTVASDI